QDRRLLLARLGGLAPLLRELLLGLAQLSLLGLDGVVLLRDLGDGRLGGERHEREAGEDARPHASGRPRASQPPTPPSSVPASTAPTPRAKSHSKRWPWAKRSIHSTPPPISSVSGSAVRHVTSARAPSSVAPSAVGVISSEAGSGFCGSVSATAASLPSTWRSVPSASALPT